MIHLSSKVQKILTWSAALILTLPIYIFALWGYASEQGDDQAARREVFYSFFPEFMHAGHFVTYLSISFCILSILLIVLSNTNHGLPGIAWKVFHIILMILSLLLLLLNIFSLL